MSIKEKAKEALRKKLGECADPGAVLDELMSGSMAGETLCRHYAIRRAFEERFAVEPKSANGLQEEIADEFRISRQAVSNIVLGQ